VANPTGFTWVDPTTNTDGTPITAGEVTGYLIGIRSTSATGSVAGTYPITASIANPTATAELFTQLGTVLAFATPFAAAIKTVGSVSSAYGPETTFTLAAPTPNPPSGFTAG